MTAPLTYYVADVFTDEPFAGNPLAVFVDARGLGPETMQSIAREMNLSETTFVFPSEERPLEPTVRIFTPSRELPFAGHPTIGTAIVLSETDPALKGEGALILQETIGPVVVNLERREAGPVQATLTAAQLPHRHGDAPDTKELAKIVGLPEEALTRAPFAPSIYDAGVTFTIIPLGGAEALEKAQVDTEAYRRTYTDAPGSELYLVVFEPDGEIRARMFAPALGIAEDPATGAAAVALSAFIADHLSPPKGTSKWRITQGKEMGRPSELRLEADIDDGKLGAVRLGGSAVIVAEGKLYVDGRATG